MQPPHHTIQSWQPALRVATPNQPFQATQWQHFQSAHPEYTTDRRLYHERLIQPYRNSANQNYYNRQHQYQHYRRDWH